MHTKRSGLCFLKISVFLFFLGTLTGISAIDAFSAEKSFNQTSNIKITEEENYTNTNQPTWIKYKAKNDGYIRITAENIVTSASETDKADYANGSWTLYASDKKTALSGKTDTYNTADVDVHAYTQTYGVKKNVTYYLKVAGAGSVNLKCKFKKVKESSGSKKSKAKTIAKNQTIQGTIAAGSKTEDWYKIKITQKQILNIYYSGETNDKLKLTFSGTYLQTAKRYVIHGNTAVNHTYSTERVQPGTYYVKVERANSTSSGYYTLKWT